MTREEIELIVGVVTGSIKSVTREQEQMLDLKVPEGLLQRHVPFDWVRKEAEKRFVDLLYQSSLERYEWPRRM